jgi:AcrR family transcriptional regulator
MSPTRHRPSGSGARARVCKAGFDARPERPSSLRAQAQRVFREAAARDESFAPDLPSDVADVRPELQQTELTQQVRALYEEGVVPVREIARRAGVNERTLYRYVEKGGWRRRYGGKGLASAVAKRAAKREVAPPRPCVTAKGAGGRFIRAEDAGKPQRSGMKALDPQGEARALADCARAAALSDEALSRTQRLRDMLSDARTLSALVGVLRDLAAACDATAGPADAGAPKAQARKSETPARDVETLRADLARKLDDWVKTQEDVAKRGAT